MLAQCVPERSVGTLSRCNQVNACLITSRVWQGTRSHEARPSELVCRIEGATAARRKLTATVDLSSHARCAWSLMRAHVVASPSPPRGSYQRYSKKLSIPLAQGAGTLQVCGRFHACRQLATKTCCRLCHCVSARYTPGDRLLISAGDPFVGVAQKACAR